MNSDEEWTEGVKRALELCSQAQERQALVRVELIGLTLALREALRQFEPANQPNTVTWILHTLSEKT